MQIIYESSASSKYVLSRLYLVSPLFLVKSWINAIKPCIPLIGSRKAESETDLLCLLLVIYFSRIAAAFSKSSLPHVGRQSRGGELTLIQKWQRWNVTGFTQPSPPVSHLSPLCDWTGHPLYVLPPLSAYSLCSSPLKLHINDQANAQTSPPSTHKWHEK